MARRQARSVKRIKTDCYQGADLDFLLVPGQSEEVVLLLAVDAQLPMGGAVMVLVHIALILCEP